MCVHRTVHNCCTQYCTEQTWQFSPLPSRRSPQLRWCLFEGRGGGVVWNYMEQFALHNSTASISIFQQKPKMHIFWQWCVTLWCCVILANEILLNVNIIKLYTCTSYYTTRMWANAQPDGRPAEYKWRTLFNAAKTPTTRWRAVTLPRLKTRWNL